MKHHPYEDFVLSDKLKIRTFDVSNTNFEDFVWHQDEKDRRILVIAGNDWQFQFDDELPFFINKDEIISVPKEKYHRIIPGSSTLIIAIEE